MINRSGALCALAALTFPLRISAAEPVGEGSSAASTAGTKDMLRREVAAFNAHDAAAVTKFHAPSASIAVLPSGKVLSHGTEQIQAFFTRLFKSTPNVRITLEKQYDFKNVIVNHYTMVGGSGSELIAIYDVRHGVIANEWLIF